MPRDAGAGGTRAGILNVAANFMQGWMGAVNKSVQQKQIAANQEVANAHANLTSSWVNFENAAKDPRIPSIQKKLQGQAQAGSALQPILTKFMSGQQLTDDEQKAIQDLQQHALDPDEQAALAKYQSAQSAYQGAASAFKSTAAKFVAPDQQGGGGVKGAAKKVGKQLTGGGLPEFISSTYLKSLDALPQMTPSGAGPREQMEQGQLDEFNAGASTRKAEQDLLKQEVDLRTQLSKAVADPNTSTDEVTRLSDQLAAVQGKIRTPGEKLQDTLANTGIGALSKMNAGTPIKDMTPAEQSFINKTFPRDIPTNMFQMFMKRANDGEQIKDPKTGQMRAYTTDDAMADNAKWEARMRAVERGPNATQELINELNTLAKTIYPNASKEDQAKWVADRLRPSPQDKADAKPEDVKPPEANRFTQSSLYSMVQNHPELSYLVTHDPKTGYKMSDAPDVGSHWFSKDDHPNPAGDRLKFMDLWAQELQKRGAPSGFIKATTGVDVAAQGQGQQLQPPPNSNTQTTTNQPAKPTGAAQNGQINYYKGVPYKFVNGQGWVKQKPGVTPPPAPAAGAQLQPPPG
jgi:hypothetical protein